MTLVSSTALASGSGRTFVARYHSNSNILRFLPCRFTEFYGSTIAQIIAEEIPPESQIGLENSSSKILALIVSGSNFQGSACIAAAKYLTSFGYLVYLCPVKTKEPPFPWSSPEDVAYEDIFMVDDLKRKSNILVFL